MEIEAVSADWVLEEMRLARNDLNIVILDACRNNPFTRSLRSASRGLAVMETSKGLLIAYSAAPGAVAEDGDGRNSPYTTALTHAILEVHEPVMEVFQDVRETVLAATGQRQIPGEYSEVVGHFYFTTPEHLGAQPAPALPPAPTPAVTAPAVPVPAAALSPTPSPDERASHGPVLHHSSAGWRAFFPRARRARRALPAPGRPGPHPPPPYSPTDGLQAQRRPPYPLPRSPARAP